MNAARMLLVEDDPMVARSARRLLEASGFDVAWEDSSAGALARFASGGPAMEAVWCDLDLGLPPDGAELLLRAERVWPTAELVLVTGSTPDRLADYVLPRRARIFEKMKLDAAVRFLECARRRVEPKAALREVGEPPRRRRRA